MTMVHSGRTTSTTGSTQPCSLPLLYQALWTSLAIACSYLLLQNMCVT